MIGRRFRTKDGKVVTLKGLSGQNYLATTAEGDNLYVATEDLCHIIGEKCDREDCFDKPSEAQNNPSSES